MGRNTRPRKAYRPRTIAANSVERCIEGAAIIDQAQATASRAACARALDKLKRGDDARFAWCVLADAMTMAEHMAGVGICSDADCRAVIDGAQAALAAVAARQAERCSWSMRASEISAIDEGLFIHSTQLQHISLHEYETALANAMRTAHQALAGNAAAGVVMVDGMQGAGAVLSRAAQIARTA